ncbi:MAG TPA: FdtA/QdtA family cupin domain-containing protein [Chlamydiales bacterium]|nr:FdtA/QdtA family cupin domain-containing protein [Chlamydiales bacterium]
MPKLLELPSFKDERGALTVIEKVLPFSIQRVYYIYDTNQRPRAGHKHRVGQQALVCLHKECRVHVRVEGHDQDFLLNTPDLCLVLDSDDWHSIQFEPNSILLVLSSHSYMPDNYIYD